MVRDCSVDVMDCNEVWGGGICFIPNIYYDYGPGWHTKAGRVSVCVCVCMFVCVYVILTGVWEHGKLISDPYRVLGWTTSASSAGVTGCSANQTQHQIVLTTHTDTRSHIWYQSSFVLFLFDWSLINSFMGEDRRAEDRRAEERRAEERREERREWGWYC